jgi:hypothetical protein
MSNNFMPSKSQPPTRGTASRGSSFRKMGSQLLQIPRDRRFPAFLSRLFRLKPFTTTKAFMLLGWVGWPILLLIFFLSFRTTNRLYLATWANYAGQLQAKAWFDEGHYRLLMVSPDNKTQFTGRKNGPFEIWTWTHYTHFSWVVANDTDREFVTAFNQRMKQLTDEKWKARR